jgi:hypothetical protein
MHHGVDPLVDDVVYRCPGRGAEGDAEGTPGERRPRHHPRSGEEHADHGGEHDERHHARLAQLQVLAPDARIRQRKGPFGHCWPGAVDYG